MYKNEEKIKYLELRRTLGLPVSKPYMDKLYDENQRITRTAICGKEYSLITTYTAAQKKAFWKEMGGEETRVSVGNLLSE